MASAASADALRSSMPSSPGRPGSGAPVSAGNRTRPLTGSYSPCRTCDMFSTLARTDALTSVWNDTVRTITDMPSVALAVTSDVPAFEVAVPCEVFGLPRPEWVHPWYDFTGCASDNTAFGGWFRVDTEHGLDELA